MKILFVVKNYFPSVGGTQVFFQQMAEYFVQNYHDEVTVFTIDSVYGSEKLTYKKAGADFEVVNGVNVYRFPYLRWHLRPFIFIAKCLKWLDLPVPAWITDSIVGPCSPAIRKAMIGYETDIIVGSSSNYLHMRYPLWYVDQSKRKPFIFHGAIHFSIVELRKVYTPRTLLAIKSSDVYLANTSYERDMLVKAGVCTNKIQVLGCAVCLNDYKKTYTNDIKQDLGLPTDAPLIGYIGRLSPMKSLEVLLRAMSVVWLDIPNVRLMLAGHDNDYIHELQRQISQLNSTQQEKIVLIPDLDEKEKVKYFQALDIFVMPSINESFGIVFLEAWACKKPVIGARIKAIESVISENEDGLLMEPGDSHSLGDKIKQLLTDPELAIQLGEAGYKKVVEKYAIERIAEKFRKICLQQVEKY